MTFQCPWPQGGAVGSDGWVDEARPIDCGWDLGEVVVLIEDLLAKSEMRGEQSKDSARIEIWKPSTTFQLSWPRGGAIGSDGWVDETQPLDYGWGLGEVVVLTKNLHEKYETRGRQSKGSARPGGPQVLRGGAVRWWWGAESEQRSWSRSRSKVGVGATEER
jgi:hypothetical protein